MNKERYICKTFSPEKHENKVTSCFGTANVETCSKTNKELKQEDSEIQSNRITFKDIELIYCSQFMITMKRAIIFCLFIWSICLGGYTKNRYRVTSPDGEIVLSVFTNQGNWTYSLSVRDSLLLDASLLGFQDSLGNQLLSSQKVRLVSSSKNTHNGIWKPVWGKRQRVPDRYNELCLKFSVIGAAQNDFCLYLRAYNDGVAFRYSVPDRSRLKKKAVLESTSFAFNGDYTAWFYNNEYHNIGPERLSESSGIRQPVMTIRADRNLYLAVHEADLRTDAPLLLRSAKDNCTFHVEAQPVDLVAGYLSAWRVLFVGKTPGEMVDSHLLELLNPDPVGDFSWVKPGVAVWDWRINGAEWEGFTYRMDYPSWVRMVDFASEQKFSYLVLDANWYGPEHEAESNPLTGEKVNDVKRIIAYAKKKGVGIWLYLNDVGGREYPIEKTLAQYAAWGAAGIKYGFMKGSPREKNIWTQKITALCAKNRLLVDFHDGPVHPYGQMRTWPNAVTREYCQAQLDAHRTFQPKTFVTSVYVNMLAGPIDMNNGMFDLRQGNTTRVDENQPVPSTLVAEAARTLIVFSGATIIPDIPEFYRKYPPLLDFISAQKMPWLESKTLCGEIGEYIVMMRETKDAYLIGAATNEQARTLDIPLDFLLSGKSYQAVVMEDGDGAHYLYNREKMKSHTNQVTPKSVIRVQLAPGGGSCILINK